MNSWSYWYSIRYLWMCFSRCPLGDRKFLSEAAQGKSVCTASALANLLLKKIHLTVVYIYICRTIRHGSLYESTGFTPCIVTTFIAAWDYTSPPLLYTIGPIIFPFFLSLRSRVSLTFQKCIYSVFKRHQRLWSNFSTTEPTTVQFDHFPGSLMLFQFAAVTLSSVILSCRAQVDWNVIVGLNGTLTFTPSR